MNKNLWKPQQQACSSVCMQHCMPQAAALPRLCCGPQSRPAPSCRFYSKQPFYPSGCRHRGITTWGTWRSRQQSWCWAALVWRRQRAMQQSCLMTWQVGAAGSIEGRLPMPWPRPPRHSRHSRGAASGARWRALAVMCLPCAHPRLTSASPAHSTTCFSFTFPCCAPADIINFDLVLVMDKFTAADVLREVSFWQGRQQLVASGSTPPPDSMEPN